MKILGISLTLVLFAGLHVSYAFNLRVPVPLDVGLKGQEEVGPIDNYTCPDNGAFPDEEDCLYFILCWDGNAVLHKCTEVMLFDLRYLGCNHAEYVDCGDRRRPPDYPGTVTPPVTTTTVDPSAPTTTVDPTAPTTTSTPPPNGTFDCPNNGVFPHAEKCEYYWNCYDGVATLVHCEFDYLFDLVYNGCNFPEYVDCGDRERPPGLPTPTPSTTTKPPGTGPTEEPTTRDPGDFTCPAPEGTFPDPDDCSGFYVCVGNIPIHDKCPDGLHFNPELGLCDWPESAGCEV